MKYIKTFLVFVLLFTLFGCVKINKFDPNREGVNAAEVVTLIDDLVAETLDEKKVTTVRSFYENLEEKEKPKVTNLEKLVDLENQILAIKFDASFEKLLVCTEPVEILLEQHYILVDQYLLYPAGVTKYIKRFDDLKENINDIIYEDVCDYLDEINPTYLVDKLPYPKNIKDYGITINYGFSNPFLVNGIFIVPTDKDEEIEITAKYTKNGKEYEYKFTSIVLDKTYASPLNDFLSQFTFPLEKNYESISLKSISSPEAEITFKSLDEEIFTNKGILFRPDHDTFITLAVTITLPTELRTVIYKVRVNGKIANEPHELVFGAIDNIPNEVSLEDEKQVNIALEMYLNLNDEDKKLVSNYSELVIAIEKINTFKDIILANEIDLLIEGLPVEVTLEDKDQIDEVRTAYEALTVTQKKFVENLLVLEEKEAKLKSYSKYEELEIMISYLPMTISLENEALILEIQEEIVKISNEEKELISNYNKYLNCYYQYQELKINNYAKSFIPEYFIDEYSFPTEEPYFGIGLEFIPSNQDLLSDGYVWHQAEEMPVDILVKYEINGEDKEKQFSAHVLSQKYAYAALDFTDQFKQPLARNYEDISYVSATYPEAVIDFDSLNKDVFTNEGILIRPGQDTIITFRVSVGFPGLKIKVVDINLKVRGLLINEIAEFAEKKYLEVLGNKGTINSDLELPSEDLFYNLNLEWTSGDESIITSDGKYINPGFEAMQTTMYLRLIDKNNQYNSITIQYTVLIVGEEYKDMWEGIEYFLDSIHKDNITNQSFTLYGSEPGYLYVPSYNVGYLPFYTKEDLKIIQSIVPAPNNLVRSERERELTRYITVHNTGMAAPTATAKGLDKFIREKTTASSWHFSLDDKEAYQQLPINEIGWHAGDGTSRKFVDIPTGVPFDGDYNPKVTISTDGYYVLNSVKSTIAAPLSDLDKILTTSHIIDTGLVVNVINGYYFMPPTWYQKGYRKICNYGGNIASVGIESCVYEGVDFNLVMRNLGKLVSKLLLKYNLGVNAVKQHYDFAAKDCPQVIRAANRWDELISLIKIEMFAKLYLEDVEFEFISLSPDVMDNTGKIINHPGTESKVKYKVLVKYDGLEKQFDYSSVLNALTFKIK